jgi:hypothetical protein
VSAAARRAWALDAEHPFAKRYGHAREMGFFSMADEILEIADESRNDWIDKVTRSGETARVVDEEAIARSRVRIAARQWLLAKAIPQAFGDRLEHTGGLKLEDVTPRPQRPSDEGWAEDVRRFRQAFRDYNARALAEAEAEKARALPPAGKSDGNGTRGQ